MNTVFVAPYLMTGTLVYIRAMLDVPGVKLAIVTQHALSSVPDDVRRRLVGHFQVARALDPGEVSRAVDYFQERLGQVDRVTGVLEEVQVCLGAVRDMTGVPGMGRDAALNFRDKSRMKSLLREHGIPCARHCLARSSGEALAFAQQTGFPLVSKPPAGLGARDTFQIPDARRLGEVLASHPPTAEVPILFEEFVRGQEYSFESVCLESRTVWHSLTRYFPSPLEVMQNPWIQWAVLLPREVDHPRFDDIREIASNANRVLGMHTGLSHLEWFRRDDGSIAVSEVGARPPGAQIMKLISFAHDVDFYRVWSRLIGRDAFEPLPRRFAAGAAYLRGQGQGRVKAVHGLEQAQKELGSLVMACELPRPGQAKSSSYEGEGYVLVRHPDTEVVKAALKRLVSLIRVELSP